MCSSACSAAPAFLTRAPVVFAMPFYGLWCRSSTPDRVDRPPERAIDGGHGDARSLAGRWPTDRAGSRSATGRLLTRSGSCRRSLFFLWYNADRFGSPFESGYGLATLPPFLEVQREQGLFSLAHLGMNIDYLFLHLPKIIPTSRSSSPTASACRSC